MKIHLVLCGETLKVVYITTYQVQRGKLTCRSVGHGKIVIILTYIVIVFHVTMKPVMQKW